MLRRDFISCAGLLLTSSVASAQSDYPNRPVRILNPFAPGGSGDIVVRTVIQKISQNTGKSFAIEVRSGAAGKIGYEAGTRSAPDGHTLVITDTTFTMLPALQSQLHWQSTDALSPVAVLVSSPFLILVRPELKVGSLKDFIEMARANPGKFNYGSAGIGSINHIATELFKQEARLHLTHVPFKGMTEAVAAILGDQLDVILIGILPVSAHIKAGKLVPLAVASPQRLSSLPTIPTADEAGVPGYRAGNWFGLTAPKGTPTEYLDWLHRQCEQALSSPEVRERLLAAGLVPATSTREQFGKTMEDDAKRWANVIRTAGIRAE